MSKRKNEILTLLESLKQQTDELLSNQALYGEMVDNNEDGLLVVDGNGVIRFANRAAAEMFNRKKAKKLEGEMFAFNPVVNETTEIEIAIENKICTVEMFARKIDWAEQTALLVILRASADKGKIRSSLQKASESLKAMINASPLAIIVVDIGGLVALWSRGAERIFVWSELEMRGQPFPFKDTPIEEILERAASGEQIAGQEISGSFGLYGLNKTLQLWASPLSKAEGTIGGVMLMVADVTETKLKKQQMEQALLSSEKRFRMVLSNSPISVSCQDAELRYSWLYNTFAGLPEVQMLGKRDAELFAPEDAAQLDELKSRVLRSGEDSRAEVKIQHEGRLYFYDISVEPITDSTGNVIGVSCAATDISTLRHTESLAAFALHHDTLTGLPNRLLFKERLQQAIVLAQNENSPCAAVIHFGLDQFKTINQCFGHTTGDHLLLDVSKRMTEVMYEIDTVSRVGGDEFLILVHNAGDSDNIPAIVRKVMEALQRPFNLNGQEIYVTASLGVAMYPSDGATADELLKNADAAMHRAKEDFGRGNFQFFCSDMNSLAMRKLMLEIDLRRALEQEEFHLHYQPQVDLRSNAIVGAEALIRWNHPKHGSIPPSDFILAAERSGMIKPIGDWVLQSACHQYRAWIDAGLPAVRVAVNLSAKQLMRSDFAHMVESALSANKMPAEFLELELTESMLMQDVESTINTLYELKRMGVRLSIDDFGTGYSSLNYLKRFPLDILKIDRTFVCDLGTELDDGEIARAIIAMAHALHLEVVAEGVENVKQHDFMRDCDCDYIQGYFYSKPLPAEDFAKLLKGKALGLFVVQGGACAA